jgi:hypothetical protein
VFNSEVGHYRLNLITFFHPNFIFLFVSRQYNLISCFPFQFVFAAEMEKNGENGLQVIGVTTFSTIEACGHLVNRVKMSLEVGYCFISIQYSTHS